MTYGYDVNLLPVNNVKMLKVKLRDFQIVVRLLAVSLQRPC